MLVGPESGGKPRSLLDFVCIALIDVWLLSLLLLLSVLRHVDKFPDLGCFGLCIHCRFECSAFVDLGA